MARIRFVSFDLDGTLFDNRFVDSVWLEEIPRLYSVKKRVSIDDAKEKVLREYGKVGKKRLEWYDLQYWIEKFGLDVAREELLKKFENRIKAFPEVPRVLEQLRRKGFRLIVVTNARREFAELELQKADMEKHFERVFSSTSDFRMVKKTADLYRRVCNILGISPQEIVHVGDDPDFDFKVPRKLGITAFHLDRTGKQKGECVIYSMNELNRRLARPEGRLAIT
ncbi:MAG: HAD family hydrolase [Candidatus Bathyarchaeota archaeon]|nr:MAG: HAD family hydrolase [Candidatus Bathyarchaeota archaeon]